MSGSQQSSRCSAIWNVMKRSRYMWLGGKGSNRHEQMNVDIHTWSLPYTKKQVHIPTDRSTSHTSETPVAPVVTNTCHAKKLKLSVQQCRTYTVFLSCLISLEENSLRMSRKAKLSGGPPSPWGLGSLNANSIPSLENSKKWRGRHEPGGERIIYLNKGGGEPNDSMHYPWFPSLSILREIMDEINLQVHVPKSLEKLN